MVSRTLLEQGGVPLKTIARRSGLGDVANLRRQFRAAYGIAPQAYQERFGPIIA